MSKKQIFGAVLIAGTAAFITVLATRSGGRETPVKQNPQAQLVDASNNALDFTAFEGKVVFVNNWASWCPPCIAEMPSIQELKTRLKDEEVVFVMVSFDQDPGKAESFIDKRKFDFDVYFPGEKYPYLTSSIPATFILNKRGEVVSQHVGMADYGSDEFADRLKALAHE